MARMERIEWLLNELRYEVQRGMMEREIDETLGYDFCVPISQSIPNGVVYCSFRTRPTHVAYMMGHTGEGPKLKVLSGGKS